MFVLLSICMQTGNNMRVPVIFKVIDLLLFLLVLIPLLCEIEPEESSCPLHPSAIAQLIQFARSCGHKNMLNNTCKPPHQIQHKCKFYSIPPLLLSVLTNSKLSRNPVSTHYQTGCFKGKRRSFHFFSLRFWFSGMKKEPQRRS